MQEFQNVYGSGKIQSLFARWPIPSVELLLLGTFTYWNFRFLELLLPGTFAPGANWPGNFRFLELLFSRVFAPWNFHSLLVHAIDLRHSLRLYFVLCLLLYSITIGGSWLPDKRCSNKCVFLLFFVIVLVVVVVCTCKSEWHMSVVTEWLYVTVLRDRIIE